MILKGGKRIDGCSDTVPIGTLNPFLGTIAPYGYLICQGQKVSKTTYKELYKICGDTFGQSTDTEFYLPDLRGQTIAGYKEGDSTFGTLGGLIGSLTHLHSTGNHTLTINEMPKHSHKTGIQGDRAGQYIEGNNSAYVYFNQTSGVNTTETGGSQPHNHGNTSSTSSVQPTIVLNWIVKAFQLMPNQSYVSTVNQDSDTNTYSCNYINDKIVPTGGKTGQVLAKKSNTDNDTEWVDQTGKRADYDSLPVGSVVDFDGDTIPEGYEEVTDKVLWSGNELPAGKTYTLTDNIFNYRTVCVVGAWGNKFYIPVIKNNNYLFGGMNYVSGSNQMVTTGLNAEITDSGNKVKVTYFKQLNHIPSSNHNTFSEPNLLQIIGIK